MKLDLTSLFDDPGAFREFDTRLQLDEVKRWGSPIFGSPVSIKGRAENRSGIVTLTYTADFLLQAVCDRCLTDISRKEHMEFSHILVLSLNREDNDEFIVVSDGRLDLAELAASDILLGLPTAMVCDPACKGLCPTCGKNLNTSICGCQRQSSAGRFDILRDLLKD